MATSARCALAAFALLIAASAVEARPVHIVAYGDSMTAGWLVPRKDAYPAQLQAALRKKGYDVVVTNAGINGGTFTDALLHFDEAIGPDTDIALVEFGTNDVRQHTAMKTVRSRLAELVAALRRRKIEVLVIGFKSLKLGDVARAENVAYAEWDLPPGKYRARDNAHYSAQGYAIVVGQMLPQIESLIARVKERR
ncbi:MAG TPA: GDSL-type esterase/lipase family protein [Pseudolabrys sp.]|nr:GDSL-type esterase/lipase family protein [Pseudolabrys sp.]